MLEMLAWLIVVIYSYRCCFFTLNMQVLDFYTDSCLTSPLSHLNSDPGSFSRGFIFGLWANGTVLGSAAGSWCKRGFKAGDEKKLRAGENIVFGIEPDCLLSYTPLVKTDISK